jgi:hypothetical protein
MSMTMEDEIKRWTANPLGQNSCHIVFADS